MPSNIILMSNPKSGLLIALPAYSLDRILRLSFLMTHTVGDLILGHKKNRPNFSLRVYLNFARHFPAITNNDII